MSDEIEFELEQLEKGKGWGEYIKGVAWVLRETGLDLKGWEGVMSGDIPQGAGLSSSAAVELASARAFIAASDLKWDPVTMAQICQKAEIQWVGVNSGIMDQMVSAVGEEGHALFLDCRSLEFAHISIPKDIAVVVLDTSTRRGLVESAYNERHEQCDAVARHFGASSLRDVGLEEFKLESEKIDKIIMRRARHVITENQRVLDAIVAMREANSRKVGNLFNESHASLRDDFEVTNEALNQIVECAQTHPACFGARMTGAGFGGCAVALVKKEQVETFIVATENKYQSISGLKPVIYVCQPSQGVRMIR